MVQGFELLVELPGVDSSTFHSGVVKSLEVPEQHSPNSSQGGVRRGAEQL